MTITLSQPYATYANGATVDLDNATEAALVAQGRASYTTNPGTFFNPLTAAEQQNLRDSTITAGTLTSAQVAMLATLSYAPYASVSLTATASGQRQALGSSRAISLTSSGGGSIYYRFSDASGAIAVTTTDSTAALTTAATQLTVPTGYPFFEYLQVSSGPTFTLSLLS